MRSRRRQGRSGLTLLEVVISVALITMLISGMLTFYWQSVEIRGQTARAADRTEIARQVLDRMATELRGCLGLEQLGFPVERQLVGTRRSISFLTTALPDERLYRFFGEFDELLPGQHDVREVSYELWIDPNDTTEEGEPLVGGIIRTEKKTLNQFLIDEQDPLQLRRDLWSHELGYLEFRYFDGVEWSTSWGVTEGNPLPQAIQITVGYDSITQEELDDADLDVRPIEQYPLDDERERPDRYSVIVRIPAADRFFSSRLHRAAETMGTGRPGDQFGVEGRR